MSKIYLIQRAGSYNSEHYFGTYGNVFLHSTVNTGHPLSYEVTAPWTADTKPVRKRSAVNCGFVLGSPLHAVLTIIFSNQTVDIERSQLSTLTYIILRSAHTVYLCVLCGSQNKQRLFPYTALTDWFV
jgi:hypothetical protein